jgi:RsiW-degrading membrane proteinase PrsW (M82 family)
MNLGFYGIKIVSIFIVSVLYFILGTALSLFLDRIISNNDPKQRSTISLFAEIASIFGLLGIIYYIIRNIVTNMPFILDGVYGFHYSMLKEASGGIIIAYILFTYQKKLRAMLFELQSRITRMIA